MLWFYKEKKYLIISLLVVIIDGLLVYFIPSYFSKINYFYPMLTISLIPFLSSKKIIIFNIILLGILYDLLYTNIFLYNVVIFLLLAIINQKIIKYLNNSIYLYLLLAILNIIIYDTLSFSLVIIANYQEMNINDLVYKITHSLLLNIMSVIVYFFYFRKLLLKHKI